MTSEDALDLTWRIHQKEALDFIDDKIAELEPELQAKETEAEEKEWTATGKKMMAVIELANHIISLKRIKTILVRES